MLVAEVRILFQTRINENPDHNFHPLDLDRTKDEKYIQRVLKHCCEDPKQAADMLWDILTWRKSVGATDINESNIKMEYVEEGIVLTVYLCFKFCDD